MTNVKTQERTTKTTPVEETKTQSRKLEWVNIEDCVVDETYQRDLCEKWVDKLIATWDSNKCEPLKTVKRKDGHYYIFDGSHRLEAMRRKKYKAVPCWVYDGFSYADEVGMFVSQVTSTKRLKTLDTFKANLCIKDPVDMMIQAVLDKYGFVAKAHNDSNCFRCLSDARMTVKRSGYDMLDSIFEVYEKSGWRKTSGQKGFKATHFRIIKQLLTDNLDNKNEIIDLLKTQYPAYMTYQVAAYTNCKEDAAEEMQACRIYANRIKK